MFVPDYADFASSVLTQRRRMRGALRPRERLRPGWRGKRLLRGKRDDLLQVMLLPIWRRIPPQTLAATLILESRRLAALHADCNMSAVKLSQPHP